MPVLKTREELGTSVIKVCSVAIVKRNIEFSAKVRPDDQDTQQRCEQSDKKADA